MYSDLEKKIIIKTIFWITLIPKVAPDARATDSNRRPRVDSDVSPPGGISHVPRFDGPRASWAVTREKRSSRRVRPSNGPRDEDRSDRRRAWRRRRCTDAVLSSWPFLATDRGRAKPSAAFFLGRPNVGGAFLGFSHVPLTSVVRPAFSPVFPPFYAVLSFFFFVIFFFFNV